MMTKCKQKILTRLCKINESNEDALVLQGSSFALIILHNLG